MCENNRIESYRPICKEIRIRSTLVCTWRNLFESRSKKHYSFGKSVMLVHLYLIINLLISVSLLIHFSHFVPMDIRTWTFITNMNDILFIKENEPFFFFENGSRLLQIHDWIVISIIKVLDVKLWISTK